MPDSLRDLFRTALSSGAPMSAVETLIRDRPDLPEFVGKVWAGGIFSEDISPDVARLLVERGAPLSIHAAARFGLVDRVRDLIKSDASLVHAKGDDGCIPLHFAHDIATAELFLEHGADMMHAMTTTNPHRPSGGSTKLLR